MHFVHYVKPVPHFNETVCITFHEECARFMLFCTRKRALTYAHACLPTQRLVYIAFMHLFGRQQCNTRRSEYSTHSLSLVTDLLNNYCNQRRISCVHYSYYCEAGELKKIHLYTHTRTRVNSSVLRVYMYNTMLVSKLI